MKIKNINLNGFIRVAIVIFSCNLSLCAADGNMLYSQHCDSCHGKNGKTIALKVSGQIAGINKNELAMILQKYKSGTLDKYGHGVVMTAATSKLSNADIEAISKYVSELK
ncbi:MAG: cytochrome c [Campylobacterales bacterium]